MTRPTRPRNALLAAIAVVGAALIAVPSALATFPGDNGRLLYERDSQIWTSNPDGSDEHVVTHTNSESGHWSPDGRQITFSISLEPDDHETGLWIVNQDGSGRTKLEVVHEDDFPGNPSWSRDGRAVVFEGAAFLPSPPFAPFTYASGIRAIDRDGSHERWILTANEGGQAGGQLLGPVWSPVADVVAFTTWSSSGSSRIGVVSVKDGSLRWYLPTWDFSQPCGQSAEPCALEISGLSWSPDGTRLLFRSDCKVGLPSDPAPCPGEPAGMSILDVDDFERHVLPVEGFGPVWSPDGTKIAFWRTRTGPEIPGQLLEITDTVYVMDADGTDVRAVANGAAPDWQAIPKAKPPAPPDRPGPPNSPQGPPAHVPNPPTPPSHPAQPSPEMPGGGGDSNSRTDLPSTVSPHPVIVRIRTLVHAPFRARHAKPIHLVVRFSRSIASVVRLQEKRGKRFVTILSKRASGKRVAFAIKPGKGVRTFKVVHAHGFKAFKVRGR